MRFIDEHVGEPDEPGLRWGVESICTQLTELGCKMASATYYEHRFRNPTVREVRDEELKPQVVKIRTKNCAVYGAREVWLQLNRDRIEAALPIVRCTVKRPMGEMGLRGAIRGKAKRTRIADPLVKRPGHLVGRRFTPLAPDPTYVSTWVGWVDVALAIDAYGRRIIGWRSSTSITARLVLDAIEHAVWTRGREGRDVTGAIQHHEHGGQHASVAYSERLAADGLYKTELIKARDPWRTIDLVEVATAEWVDWFNYRRLYEYCGDLPPAQGEGRRSTLNNRPRHSSRSQTKKSPNMPGGFIHQTQCA